MYYSESEGKILQDILKGWFNYEPEKQNSFTRMPRLAKMATGHITGHQFTPTNFINLSPLLKIYF